MPEGKRDGSTAIIEGQESLFALILLTPTTATDSVMKIVRMDSHGIKRFPLAFLIPAIFSAGKLVRTVNATFSLIQPVGLQ